MPHALFFAVNIALVMLFANADINSRVASTCPFYYWAAASVISEASASSTQSLSLKAMAWFIKTHNLAYLLLNFVLFLMEVGFL